MRFLTCRHRILLAVIISAAAVMADIPNLYAQPGQGRYDIALYGRLDDYGASAIVRRINTAKEIAGGFKYADQRKNSQAFVLTETGFERLTGEQSADFSTSYSVNDRGEVVGAVNTTTSLLPYRATRLKTFQFLPLLTGDNSGTAYEINDNGEVAGYSSGKKGERAVWWPVQGPAQELKSLPGTHARALALNNSGDVVGTAGAGLMHAVLWPNKGEIVELGTLPGFTASEAVAINDRGEIAGYATGTAVAPNISRAVLWSPSAQSITDLGVLPGGDSSRAYDINESGTVVGTSTSTNGNRAFVWTAALGMADLTTLQPLANVVLTEAVGINRNGDIVAIGHEVDPTHAAGGHEDHEQPRGIFVLTWKP